MNNMQEYKSFWTMLGMRFLRGFVAGFMASMAMLTQASTMPIQDLLTNYKAWVFASISAGVTGACLAIDKWLRSDGSDYKS